MGWITFGQDVHLQLEICMCGKEGWECGVERCLTNIPYDDETTYFWSICLFIVFLVQFIWTYMQYWHLLSYMYMYSIMPHTVHQKSTVRRRSTMTSESVLAANFTSEIALQQGIWTVDSFINNYTIYIFTQNCTYIHGLKHYN